MKTGNVNVEREQHCNKEQNGCRCQRTAAAMKRKKQVEQTQDNEKGRGGESKNHTKKYDGDTRFNHGESWSAGFLDLSIHYVVQITLNRSPTLQRFNASTF